MVNQWQNGAYFTLLIQSYKSLINENIQDDIESLLKLCHNLEIDNFLSSVLIGLDSEVDTIRIVTQFQYLLNIVKAFLINWAFITLYK